VPERVHQADQVARLGAGVIAAGRLVGQADAALIDGDYLVLLGQTPRRGRSLVLRGEPGSARRRCSTTWSSRLPA
jgi:hypothetical protein